MIKNREKERSHFAYEKVEDATKSKKITKRLQSLCQKNTNDDTN